MAGCRVIINADDFGLTPGVSAGIIRAHREGVLTSTTYMVNWPWSPAAAPLLRDAPNLGVGLHLNLTAGPPVLAPAAVPSLVGRGGRFVKGARHLLLRVRAEEVRREWAAQVQRFRDLTGRLPTHLDSHHYVHTIPRLAAALVAVARDFGIPAARAVRPGDFLRLPRPAGEAAASALYAALAVRSRPLLAGSGLKVPGGTLLGPWDREGLRRRLAGLGPGTWEVVVHPGQADADLRRLSRFTAGRETELAALVHPALRGALQAAGAELIHFGHL